MTRFQSNNGCYKQKWSLFQVFPKSGWLFYDLVILRGLYSSWMTRCFAWRHERSLSSHWQSLSHILNDTVVNCPKIYILNLSIFLPKDFSRSKSVMANLFKKWVKFCSLFFVLLACGSLLIYSFLTFLIVCSRWWCKKPIYRNQHANHLKICVL